MRRYLRLAIAFAGYGLTRELSFRANFVAKLSVEVIWFFILIVFYDTVFSKTEVVATWSKAEYLFFLGCYFAMEGFIETFFLENCNQFADLVRTGDLDFYLLRPIDEQFLVSCRNFDWSTAPNVVMGGTLMVVALVQMDWTFNPARLVAFGVLFFAGIAIAYSFLLMLTSTSVWLVRNQSLLEVWWLFTSLMRYPREIFGTTWAAPLGWFFTFVVPVMVVVNVPAQTMVKVFSPYMVGFVVVTAPVMLGLSRWVFRRAMRTYRSASS